jgi:hypothetical protein
MSEPVVHCSHKVNEMKTIAGRACPIAYFIPKANALSTMEFDVLEVVVIH